MRARAPALPVRVLKNRSVQPFALNAGEGARAPSESVRKNRSAQLLALMRARAPALPVSVSKNPSVQLLALSAGARAPSEKRVKESERELLALNAGEGARAPKSHNHQRSLPTFSPKIILCA